MSREHESISPISHLEEVYRIVAEEDAVLLARERLSQFSTHFTERAYKMLNRFALPQYRDANGVLATGIITTAEVLFPMNGDTIRARVQASLIRGGWDDWDRSWRDLGLHFEDKAGESSLLVPSLGWDGRQVVPVLDPDSPKSFIDFKNGVDVLSYMERRLSSPPPKLRRPSPN